MHRMFAAAALLAAPGISQVVINEFQYDDAGATDNFEFVELYNAGAPVDISNWKIVCRDPLSAAFGGADPDLVFTISPGLPFFLPTGGFFVLGSAAVLNVNQVIPDTSIENDNESLELYDNLNVLQDSLCYEMGLGAFGPHPVEGRGFHGDLAVGDGPTSSIARMIDGFDTNSNSLDFAASVAPTPGASNNVANALPYVDDFNGGTLPGTVPGWHKGFVLPNYVDPLLASTQNPQAKPASPEGGLAMMTWDTTGGGNTVTLASSPVSDVVVECYAYFYPLMTPVNPVTSPYNQTIVVPGQYNWADGEYWAIGARGSSSANGNPPNVGTYFADVALGIGTRHPFVTGIAWMHYRTRNYSRLYLVDLHDGASPGNPNFTVIGGPIDIVAGVNDGWQRVRLHVQGNEVIANFGGDYGEDDGTRFYATTTTTNPGQVYVAYREAVLSLVSGPTQGPHPPAFDKFTAHAPTTTKTFLGGGSPLSNSNVPQIGAQGFPILGSTGFTVKGSNMIPFPNNISILVVSTFAVPPPGYPIPGAPPGTNAFALSFDYTAVNLPDALGNVSDTVLIPGDPFLLGLPLTHQYAVLDSGLTAFSLAIAVSPGMETVIGN